MSNYPDSTGEHDPRAPWAAQDASSDASPRCAECDALLDDRAVDEGSFAGTGWQGELCSKCADAGECSCDDRGWCSPRCSDADAAEWERVRRDVMAHATRSASSVHPLAVSDPALFQRLCRDNPERLYPYEGND